MSSYNIVAARFTVSSGDFVELIHTRAASEAGTNTDAHAVRSVNGIDTDFS